MTTATPPPLLPAALRLPPQRSVLALGPYTRLLGLDPASAVAVDGLSPALAEMVDALAEPAASSQLVTRAVDRGADAAAAEALLRELLAAGAVVDAAGPERLARHRGASTVLVTGDGPLAVGVAIGLVHAGVGTVHTTAAGTVVAADLGTGYQDEDQGRDRLAATAGAVHRLVPSAQAGPPPLRLVPDLVVLADAAVPDPVRVSRLMVDGTPHLPARLRDGVGVVGPLVLPGRTACLGCVELHRCARDPAWPRIAAQLAGRSGRGDPASAAATAALATAQALAALDGASGGPAPPALEATLEFDPAAATLVRRSWTARSECGCGAARRGDN